MSTLPPPGIQPAPEDSLEKKVYKIVDDLSDYLPVVNDRNRLGFCLYKYIIGEGDHPTVLVQYTKVKIEGITPDELAGKINSEIEKIKEQS